MSVHRTAVLALTMLVAAALPADEPQTAADYDGFVQPSDREHWAFRPVQRPAIPEVRDAAWPRNPIDRFLLAKLEARGWTPAEQAAPRQWLRRVYLDVIGLPPTPEEQTAFLSDPSPDAAERLVDDLLARPGYGERWGRHWLDLVRFAETNGYERDGTKPHVWRYRDYVIRALNADVPFDRFTLEQLAGDELPDRTAETVIATGFSRLGPWDDEPANPQEDQFDQLDDMVATTSQVWLGQTLACARCHNHKFEPFSTLDYYRMVAVFRPLQRPAGGRSDLDAPAGSLAELADLAARDRELARLGELLAKKRDEHRAAFLASGKTALAATILDAFRTAPDKRTPEQKKLVADNTAALDAEVLRGLTDAERAGLTSLQSQMDLLKVATPDLPRGYFLVERPGVAPVTHVLKRGKPTSPGVEALPGLPHVLVARQPEFPAAAETSLRRLTLARWIASPENPLTARVIVNRVWQHHFGVGLVRTPSDFGVMGAPPTHPELLDWLADWFVHDAGWSLKRLHRLILTSSAYRMSKAQRAEQAEADPENTLFWRFPYRRLEVEPLCDQMLAASGQLNRTLYGPSMHPAVPRQALEGHSDPNSIWPAFNEVDASRRTVYAFIKRSLVVPMLEVLDLCDTARTTPERNITSVAPQALTLLNGDFVNRQARHFARRLEAAETTAGAQIDLAYRLALARSPTYQEVGAFLSFLQAETAAGVERGLAEPAARHAALVEACRALFNLNEFAYPD